MFDRILIQTQITIPRVHVFIQMTISRGKTRNFDVDGKSIDLFWKGGIIKF
jgi:hypothetical protein